MKKILLLSALLSLIGGGEMLGRQLVNQAGTKIPYQEAQLRVSKIQKADDSPTVDELLACPEGSVYSEAFSSSAAFIGSQCADQGRPDMSCKFYQSFSGCTNVVNGVKFFGIFNYYDEEDGWVNCAERGDIDENGAMTKPIRFEIAFYEAGEDGMPGEMVHQEFIDILGEDTRVLYNQYDPNSSIYSFTATLSKEIKMYSGFVSISAAETDPQTCWFSLLTSSNVSGAGLVEINGGESWMSSFNGTCFCLLGDANRPIADKALNLDRVLNPTTSSTGKYEKVQIELSNIGGNAVSDATLSLYEGDKLLATEAVGVTINPGESYKYTFNKRIDCSAEGTHNFSVKNATEGDENIGTQILAFSTTNNAGLSESASEDCSMEYITNVKIGDIDNTSEASEYSDFRDHKTALVYGETLTLTVKGEGYGDYIKVWVDWNGNGQFTDEGEFIGYALPPEESDGIEGSIDIAIPDGAEVTEGGKTLRIILTYGDAQPHGSYSYGETEDYTLTIVRPENAPALSIDKESFDKTIDQPSTANDNLTIGNTGDTNLEASISVNYSLPYSPSYMPVTKALKPDAKFNRPTKARPAMKAGENTGDAFVLKYCADEFGSSIGLESGTEVTYAAYYPSEMLSSISGMTISSVDVYVYDPSETSEIVIYGEKSQSANGEAICTQTFTPIADSWNHIELENPVEITGNDLWIGAKFGGFEPATYQIGVDNGPSVIGFADRVNVGGNTWWSLADLGQDGNILIKANVTGERTAAIDWLDIDKTNVSIEQGEEEDVSLTFSTAGLEGTLYEAAIKISSNDPLTSVKKIPVYLNCNTQGSINEITEMATATIYADAYNNIVVKSDKEVSCMMAVDVKGQLLGYSYSNILDMGDFQKGIYVVRVVYADGSDEATTIIIK